MTSGASPIEPNKTVSLDGKTCACTAQHLRTGAHWPCSRVSFAVKNCEATTVAVSRNQGWPMLKNGHLGFGSCVWFMLQQPGNIVRNAIQVLDKSMVGAPNRGL